MAISWDTYYALPKLDNYTEAKRHYDNVAPILRDEYKTRPAGRRSQKWCSIWEAEDKSICIGYGAGEIKDRSPFISYQPSGTITLHVFGRHSSASTNERMQRILGIDVSTHQYDTWVRCHWYAEGKRQQGYMPLHRNHKADWSDKEGRNSVFVREKDGALVFLNYTYPVTHKLNRPAVKEALAPSEPFLNWVNAMCKLQGVKHIHFEDETRAEYFGWSEYKDWKGRVVPNPPPNTRWARDVEANRAQFLEWAQSDSVDDWMRAAITVQWNATETPRAFLLDQMLSTDPDNLLIKEVHTGGRKVTDRYKRYLRA